MVAPGTRDQTRAPMQWTAGKNAGFTTGTPWLRLNDNFDVVNAEDEAQDPSSILNFYRAAIALRKKYKTLVYGGFEPVCEEKENFLGYIRADADGRFFVEFNLSAETAVRPVQPEGEHLLGNYGAPAEMLRPFEANIYRLR